MPTLSLQGRICVPLFLFIFVLSQLVTTPLFAQNLHNRTEEMYPLGTVIISAESLPNKVYEAQKNKILISIVFLEKGTDNVLMNSLGTGFVTENPGTIITARHLLTEILVNAEVMKNERIKSNPNFDYDYMFMGTIITRTAWINFPLSLVAVGEKGTLKDIMVLRTDIQTIQRAQIAGDAFNPNPYSILMKTSKFVDANVGDRVYITGFAPGTTEYLDKNNKSIPVYMDLINHTFPAEVEVLITDMPGNRAGVKILYRLRDSAEPGFSGGKVINNEGEVIGMTISMSPSKNFVYAISSKDLKQFLKDHKVK